MLLIKGGVKLHDGHRDRLRKKFVLGGIDGWPHHEVLELLLFYAIARRNTNDIAHRLIEKFGSFNGVFGGVLFPVFRRHHTDYLFKGAVECRGCRKSAVHGDLCQILL